MASIQGSPSATPSQSQSSQAYAVPATPRPGGYGLLAPKTPSAAPPGSGLNLNALMTPAIGKTPGSVLQRSRMHNSFASTNFNLAEKAKGVKGPALGGVSKRTVFADVVGHADSRDCTITEVETNTSDSNVIVFRVSILFYSAILFQA